MTALRTSLRDYLAMRRGLGFKLRDAGASLLDFVSFMERKRASRITTRLALKWAQKSKSTLPMDWARRLSFVRGFARYLNAIDSRSEIPPNGLLPYRPQRTRPYIYTEQQIEQLLAAALTLPPAGGLRRWTYHCLLGLFTVTGLRLGEALSVDRIRFGAVIDLFNASKLGFIWIFNIADVSIDIGIALLLIVTFLARPGSDRLSAHST